MCTQLRWYDLDLDPVTLIDVDLDIMIVYLNSLGQGFQKLEPGQDRQTDTQTDATECVTTPHWRVVVMCKVKQHFQRGED